jgi:hypothetical protein
MAIPKEEFAYIILLMNFGSLVDTSPGKKKGAGNDGLSLGSFNGTVNSMTQGNNPINTVQGVAQPAMNVLNDHKGSDIMNMEPLGTDNIHLNFNEHEGKKKGHHRHRDHSPENNLMTVNGGPLNMSDLSKMNPTDVTTNQFNNMNQFGNANAMNTMNNMNQLSNMNQLNNMNAMNNMNQLSNMNNLGDVKQMITG